MTASPIVVVVMILIAAKKVISVEDIHKKDVARLEKKIKNVTDMLIDFINEERAVFVPPSTILKNKPSYRDQLEQWLPPRTSWKLCWRASEHGWSASDFHQRCDYQGPTVTIIRVGVYIFGGYVGVSWGGSQSYRKSTKSFLFSLKNKDHLPPFKSPVISLKAQYALHTRGDYGPTFGGGHDIRIGNNAKTSMCSYTNFGNCYELPSGYSYGADNTHDLLAGNYWFIPSEVEVFYEH